MRAACPRGEGARARAPPPTDGRHLYLRWNGITRLSCRACCVQVDAPRGSTQHPRRTAPHLYAPQLEALFETLDLNQSGSLSLDEFQQFLESIQCKHTRKQVRAAMKQAKARRGLSRAAEVALTAAMKPPRELKEVVLRHTTSRLYRQRRTQRRAAVELSQWRLTD